MDNDDGLYRRANIQPPLLPNHEDGLPGSFSKDKPAGIWLRDCVEGWIDDHGNVTQQPRALHNQTMMLVKFDDYLAEILQKPKGYSATALDIEKYINAILSKPKADRDGKPAMTLRVLIEVLAILILRWNLGFNIKEWHRMDLMLYNHRLAGNF